MAGRRGARVWAAVAGLLALTAGSATAAVPYACGGFAMLGGAQLACSHVEPKAPPQICTFSWALTRMDGSLQVVDGSFLLPRGAINATVYQGSGYAGQLAQPIVMCQGKRST